MDSVKAFAPATVSNLACGFDLLGLAVSGLGDYVVAKRIAQPHVIIENISGPGGKALSKTNNTAIAAVNSFLTATALQSQGISLEIRKGYHFGSGLGSSAASAVAAVVAVNKLLGNVLKTNLELFPFCYDGEKSVDANLPSDNVAASLMGGLMLSNFNNKPLRLPLPTGLGLSIITPKEQGDNHIITTEERGSLSNTVPLKDHVQQSYLFSRFIQGLYRHDFNLIRDGLNDIIIEPQREQGLPWLRDIQRLGMTHNSLGCSISGSGPACWALFRNNIEAEAYSIEGNSMFSKLNFLATSVDMNGAGIC